MINDVIYDSPKAVTCKCNCIVRPRVQSSRRNHWNVYTTHQKMWCPFAQNVYHLDSYTLYLENIGYDLTARFFPFFRLIRRGRQDTRLNSETA